MNSIKRILKKIIYREPDIQKLKNKGLVVGAKFKMMGQCIIDPSHCWHISIGNNVTLAPRVHILAHDASTGLFLGYTKVSNVKIGNNVFIGAGSIVLPGVTIGDNVVIGAGSIVSRNIPTNSVAVGNPAKVICTLDEYLSKEKKLMNTENTFDEEFTLRNKHLTKKHKEQLILACEKHNKAYVI